MFKKRRKNNIPYAGYFISYVLLLAVLFILMPYAFLQIFSIPSEEHISPSYGINVPKTVKVYRSSSSKTESIDFEEYIKGVVASEMPHTFEEEALKAQAIAARTYSLAKIHYGKTPSHNGAFLCDTTHCQVYKGENELRKLKGKKWMKTGYKKISKAVDSTKGQAMYYKGKLIKHALFHSSSSGATENCEDVFVSAVPYLVSVKSPYEDEATHRQEKTSFTYTELRRKIYLAYPNIYTGTITDKTVKIINHNEGGSVAKMQIGNSILSGTEIRGALGLYSATFTIVPKDNSITFVTSGSGHGVGMSQYGANGMAKEGYSCEEILKHYYRGVEIQ